MTKSNIISPMNDPLHGLRLSLEDLMEETKREEIRNNPNMDEEAKQKALDKLEHERKMRELLERFRTY